MDDQSPFNPFTNSILSSLYKWSRFIGIVTYVFTGLIALSALALLFTGGALSQTGFGSSGFIGTGFFAVFYLLAGLLYFYIARYLMRFAEGLKRAREEESVTHLMSSLSPLNSLFKIFGYIIAIFLIFYGVIVIGALIFGSFSSIVA
jgi:hypothetical protein